ncbi:MAG: carbohydrate ABC transporter permease [Candidatus Hodarchaeota archaeon]
MPRIGRHAISNYMYILPALACLAITVFGPILRATQMSFEQYILYKPDERFFVGLDNYWQLINDPVFWLCLRNTIVWVAGSVFLQFILGFVGALVLHEKFKGRGFFRSIILMPWVMPGAIVGLMWTWLYNPGFGLINDILIRLNLINDRIAWLAQPSTALWAIILANVWRGAPFFTIMLLAGLQSIPNELYEAARVDGAPMWQRFRHITIPMIRPTIVISSIIRIIWSFNYPDMIWVMTHGGPGNSSQILASYVLQTAYERLNFGYAATMSVFTLISVFCFTLIYMKTTAGVKPVWE